MEDKKRILKMVEEGKISADEGIKLLEALESNSKNTNLNNKTSFNEDEFFNIEKNSTKGKMLYIRVKSSSGETVKVNIPVEFLKVIGAGAAIGSVDLDKHNIDMNTILNAIDNGFEGRIVEVDSNDGDKVIIEIC